AGPSNDQLGGAVMSVTYSQDLVVQTKPDQPAVPAVSDALLAVDDSLRQGLGQQADSSVALVNDLLDMAPSSVAQKLVQSGVFRDPEIVSWVASLLEAESDIRNGVSVEQQIAEIEHVLRTDRARYNRDLKLQARYRTLIASR